MEWISVKEKLPKDGSRVLTTTIYTYEKGKPQRFYYLNNYSKTLKWWDEPEDQSYERVTHWMPLPNPPKS